MSRVYSTRFIFAALAEDETAIYTVPDGFVAVVRGLTVAQVGDGAGAVLGFDATNAGGEGVAVAYIATTGSQSWQHVELRLVLAAAEKLTAINLNEPEMHVTASGYLLSLP